MVAQLSNNKTNLHLPFLTSMALQFRDVYCNKLVNTIDLVQCYGQVPLRCSLISPVVIVFLLASYLGGCFLILAQNQNV